ncbi:MAG: hypothetical protein GXP05_13420 [Alphaproteobacteria bacterium]|nr:hypothetical protein [Alphaproteobacteria bacterium]
MFRFLRALWPFVSLGTAGIEASKSKALAKIDLETAKLTAKADAVKLAAQSEAGWEVLALADARNSWKDEFWTLLLAAPLLAAFVPDLQPYIARGFAVIDTVPDWYKWGVGASISFAFARKKMPSFLQRKTS